MEIGQRILSIMAEKNITYRDLEKSTGISRSTLNRYAAKGKAIPLDKLDVIAKALGTDSKTLLGWNCRDNEDSKIIKLVECAKKLSDNDLNRLIEIAKMWGE